MEGHGDISVGAATTCVAVSHAATNVLIIHLCRSLYSRIPLPKLRLQRLLATGSYVSWPSVHPQVLCAWSVKYASPSTRPCQWESSCRTVYTKNQTIQLLCLASILFCALVVVHQNYIWWRSLFLFMLGQQFQNVCYYVIL